MLTIIEKISVNKRIETEIIDKNQHTLEMKEDRRKKERCVTHSKLAHTLTHQVDEYKLVYAHIIQCESIEREYQ